MLFREKTEKGYISLNDKIIEQIIEMAISTHADCVKQINYKGNSSDALIIIGNLEALKENNIEIKEGKLFIRTYLVIRFGENIKNVCKDIISYIEKTIVQCIQIPIEDIQIVVTGVFSKKIAKRNILYSLAEMEKENEL